MTRTSLLLTLAAAAALAGCGNQNEPIVIGPDGQVVNESEKIDTSGVELPPSIAASKTYRCKGNGIVQIDWLSDNKTANLRSEEGAVVQLTADSEGQPLTAEGYSLTGSSGSSTITLERPGSGTTTCKA